MKGILEFSGRRGRRFKSCRFDTKDRCRRYLSFCLNNNKTVPASCDGANAPFGRRGGWTSSGRPFSPDRSGAETAGSNPVASTQKTGAKWYPFFVVEITRDESVS